MSGELSDETAPPVAKYRLTVEIAGNSHFEIERELENLSNGGYLDASDGYKRDSFWRVGGRREAKLEHTNPSMTPEQYGADLDAWFQRRRAARRTS